MAHVWFAVVRFPDLRRSLLGIRLGESGRIWIADRNEQVIGHHATCRRDVP